MPWAQRASDLRADESDSPLQLLAFDSGKRDCGQTTRLRVGVSEHPSQIRHNEIFIPRDAPEGQGGSLPRAWYRIFKKILEGGNSSLRVGSKTAQKARGTLANSVAVLV